MANSEYEEKYTKLGYKRICGVDEAGRGPLAGPLVVASCILPSTYHNDDINDSKKLTDKKRRKLFEEIKENAIDYSIVVIDNKIIDELNIYQATKEGMKACIENVNCDFALVDAMKLEIDNYEPIIKGDAKSISIAAASILAKVTRDDIMLNYAKIYPQYKFEKNMGYGTKAHLMALDEYGITPIHRLSYRPVYEANNPKLDLF